MLRSSHLFYSLSSLPGYDCIPRTTGNAMPDHHPPKLPYVFVARKFVKVYPTNTCLRHALLLSIYLGNFEVFLRHYSLYTYRLTLLLSIFPPHSSNCSLTNQVFLFEGFHHKKPIDVLLSVFWIQLQ